MATPFHCDTIYRQKAPDQVSWYRHHLEKSLQWIQEAAPDREAAIIDVGGGESTLVDDLLGLRYRHLCVLDISREAIQVTQQRLGLAADNVEWRVADITQADLPEQHHTAWHDLAVFHFLVEPKQRTAYIRQVLRSLAPDGHLVIATFGPSGPRQCSGLDVVRYDTSALCKQLGPRFALVSDTIEAHVIPSGRHQQFLYAHFKLTAKS